MEEAITNIYIHVYNIVYVIIQNHHQTLDHPTMSSTFQSPLQTQPLQTRPHPVQTRYYARRVRESLSTRFAKFLCSIFLLLLLIAGLILFILWLSLRPHRPRFYLNSFTLNQPGSPISFNVSDRNPNENIGIYYGETFGSVFYYDQMIASGLVSLAFYQPPKNTTLMQGELEPAASGPMLGQITGDERAGRVKLRMEMKSRIRFKVSTWDTYHHKMHVSCDLAVGADGNLLPEFVNERCPIYF